MEYSPALLFTNGTVWCGPNKRDECALLVANGEIVALGRSAVEHAEQFAADIVDLNSGFLMPSFGDGHAHPIFGGLESQGPQIRECTSVAEIIAEVSRFADENPNEAWILGASYDGSLSEDGLFDASWLDQAVPDRPVVLQAWDYHTVWCNSKALEAAGINNSTPEPLLGEIPRKEDGSPLGVLREWGAVDLVNAVSPGHSLNQRVAALEEATARYASMGVTWVQDAWVERGDVDVYIEAARRGTLSTRVNMAFLADPRDFAGSLEWILAAHDRISELRHPLLTGNTVKFFTDGVIENETGALLEPYCSGVHGKGMLIWEPEKLAEAVSRVEALGLQVFLHAIGDAAVRAALDAVSRSREMNGPSKTRPVISHVQLAHERDLARFAELGVIANMQPLWAQLDPLMTVLTAPRIGENRTNQLYRIASIARSGARVSFGSDWPCSSADPRKGIAIATTRMTAEGTPVGGWMPEERISLEEGLEYYTRSVAFQAFCDAKSPRGTGRTHVRWGEIAAGNSADLVWLEKDPRKSPPAALPMNSIRATYLAGAPTYRLP